MQSIHRLMRVIRRKVESRVKVYKKYKNEKCKKKTNAEIHVDRIMLMSMLISTDMRTPWFQVRVEGGLPFHLYSLHRFAMLLHVLVLFLHVHC